MYNVYWDDDWQAEFDTIEEAQEYVKKDIKGMAETYNKTQKWIKQHFKWEIVKEETE